MGVYQCHSTKMADARILRDHRFKCVKRIREISMTAAFSAYMWSFGMGHSDLYYFSPPFNFVTWADGPSVVSYSPGGKRSVESVAPCRGGAEHH